MKFRFGTPREKGTSDHETERPRDPSKRRTLKQVGALVVAGITGESIGAGGSIEAEARGTYAERFAAAEQLRKNGITNFQRQAYKPGLSESLAKGISPFEYSSRDIVLSKDGGVEILGRGEDLKQEVVRAIEGMAQGMITTEAESEQATIEKLEKRMFVREKDAAGIEQRRQDAWRIYLGLPQLHGTFGISEYRPVQSVEDRYYYRIEGFLEHYRSMFHLTTAEAVQWLGSLGAHAADRSAYGNRAYDDTSGIMGTYKTANGKDEKGTYFSYYDRWDLDTSIEGKQGLIGRPFEIYDRIYYEPGTFEVIEPGKDPQKAS